MVFDTTLFAPGMFPITVSLDKYKIIDNENVFASNDGLLGKR